MNIHIESNVCAHKNSNLFLTINCIALMNGMKPIPKLLSLRQD